MQFSALAEYLQKLEKTPSRNEITQILSQLFKELTKNEIDKVTYLLSGSIAPSYEGIEFNLAEKMMVRAVALSYKVDPEEVFKVYKKVGDLGNVAEELSSKNQDTKNKLSVNHVFEILKEIALDNGKDSQERKLEKMAGLLTQVDSLSAKYIVRIPVGKLRLGFSDLTMLDALSMMETGDKKARKEIEAAFSVSADIGRVAQQIKEKGLKGIAHIKVQPGVPIRSALAERLSSAEKIAEKMGDKFGVEPKLDGFRSQLHVWGKGDKREVRIFSRNLENVTNMFPELVDAMKKIKVDSAIFDGESIAYNPKTGKFLPFQETVSRKRKHGIDGAAKDLPLKVFIFDVLYLNGEETLNKPFNERRKLLENKLSLDGDTIILTEQHIVTNAKDLREQVDKYLKGGLEGAMVKKLETPYQPGGRGFHWVKFKKHTESDKNDGSKVADTIDTVLMGAYRGKGKRASFGVGGFLIGVPDKDNKYYTLTNLGTGLSDDQFREMAKIVDDLKVDVQPADYVVDKNIAPDIWVKPKVVLEILADEITLSPRHTAGMDGDSKGFSLRFPRLIRIRDDKNADQATSVHEVKELYKMQTVH
jgi:DNA ligase 1